MSESSRLQMTTPESKCIGCNSGSSQVTSYPTWVKSFSLIGNICRLLVGVLNIKLIYWNVTAPFVTKLVWPPGIWQWLTIWNLTYHTVYFLVKGMLPFLGFPYSVFMDKICPTMTAHTLFVTILFYALQFIDPRAIPVQHIPPLFNHYVHGIVTLICLIDAATVIWRKKNAIKISKQNPEFNSHLLNINMTHCYPSIIFCAVWGVIVILGSRMYTGSWAYPFLRMMEMYSYWSLFGFFVFSIYLIQLFGALTGYIILGSDRKQVAEPEHQKQE